MDEKLLEEARTLIEGSQKPLIIQAENPDSDSLGAALALEEILTKLHKQPELYCAVDLPKYLNYFSGWDRVHKELPKEFDLVILVDASSQVLLERTFANSGSELSKRPWLVLDHHLGEADLPYPATIVIDSTAASVTELIFGLAQKYTWPLNDTSRYMIAAGIIGDTGNLVYDNTTVRTFQVMTALLQDGLDLSKIHDDRRKSYERPAAILAYKGALLSRVAYASQGRIAHATIPWEETERYSDHYNPAMLVIDEMLLVDTVQLAVVFKLYPKEKLITVKIRAKIPIAHEIAKNFGGGGHPKASGCKVKGMEFDDFFKQFTEKAEQTLNHYHDEAL